MEKKIKVLFICVHNSARSQMAEAFLKDLGGDRFQVESAGLEPSSINANVVSVMKEIGFDLSANKTQSAFDLYKQGKLYDYVVTVCDESVEESCPIFPGIVKRLHWPFPDPAKASGSPEQKRDTCRKVRDDIKSKIEDWITSLD